MENKNCLDYYYGQESDQFRFLRVPKALMKSPRFRGLSTGAKLLYGLLLDRMGLSARNGWYDNQGRVFLYYSLVEIQEELSCCHDTATKWLRELEGLGLIERKKQGMGKPAMIYVKKFATRQLPPSPTEPVEPTPDPDSGSQDFSKPAVQTSENQQSRLRKNRTQDCDYFRGE